jgi:hypothetical protein
MSTIGSTPASSSLPATTMTPDAGAPAAPASTSTASATGGGGIGDALLSGIGKLVSFASKGMQSISDALNGEVSATGGGDINPAKLQGYMMQMSSYDHLMKMAAKLQEKEDEAVKVWLR